MMWETINIIDWIFVVAPPILLCYFFYDAWKSWKQHKIRQIVETDKFEKETIEAAGDTDRN